jgi:hypothetical protein
LLAALNETVGRKPLNAERLNLGTVAYRVPWFKDDDQRLLRSLLPIKDHGDINKMPFTLLLQADREFQKPFQYLVILNSNLFRASIFEFRI